MRPEGQYETNDRLIAYLCLQQTKEGQASHAHVHEIIQGLTKLGWSVTLYEPHWPVRNSASGYVARLLEFGLVQWRLWLSIFKVDAVYMRQHPCLLPSVLVAKMFRKPVVMENNGPREDLYIAYPFSRRFSYFFGWVTRLLFQLADAAVTVTPELADMLRGETRNGRIHVIPNAANVDVFRPDAVCCRQMPEHYVLFFGALTKWHDIPTIVAACMEADWPKGVDVVIAGDGSQRHVVEQAAASCSSIKYAGVIPYREMPGVIAKSELVLVTGCNFGGRAAWGLSPLKLFEAMASGVPVLVTDLPGQADVVREHRCGLVIPERDPAALAKAVTRLWEDKELRAAMGHRAREAAVTDYSWALRSKATSDILSSLVE